MESTLRVTLIGVLTVLLLTACGPASLDAKQLTAELTASYAAYNEASRTGESTVELAAKATKLETQLAQMAEEGDPVACVSSAAVRWRDAEVEREAADTNVKVMRSHYAAALEYAKCAMAKPEALTDADKRNMTRWVEGIPDLLKGIDAGKAS